jgi:hypothetical protein
MTSLALPLAPDVSRAFERLQSLRTGDLGVVEITACGRRAVPPLRVLLLHGQSSGIYQPRCRAVDALAGIGAWDVLIEFLSAPREVADPVNRTGEDAVINAAARAVAASGDPRVPPLLLSLARTRPLAGILEALGPHRRSEAIPILVKALSEDHLRPAAEEGLLQLGPRARPALLRAASQPVPSAEWESPSSRRARRSALRLLRQIGLPARYRVWVRALAADRDPEIAARGCRAYAEIATEVEKPDILRRLTAFLPRLDWLLRQEVEAWLRDHQDAAAHLASSESRANQKSCAHCADV